MARPKVCILRAAGTNCDQETAFAFSKAGAAPEFVHINRLTSQEKNLGDYQILAIPGGFTYGDDIAAGKILANELRYKLKEDITNFIEDRKLIIGICNGFQVLVKSGLLPGHEDFRQEASLIINDSGKFEDRWVYLKTVRSSKLVARSKCVWTENLSEIIYLPVAHGEGKFVTKDKSVLERIKRNHQIIFQYCDAEGRKRGYPYNPNGSVEDIAGICDETGRILGLMPHPERHMDKAQHPQSGKVHGSRGGDGLQIFLNGVEYAKKHL